MTVVRGDRLQVALLCEPYELGQYLLLIAVSVILKLDIEAIPAEYFRIFQCRRLCALKVARKQKMRYSSGETAGKGDQPFCVFRKQVIIYPRARIKALGEAERH